MSIDEAWNDLQNDVLAALPHGEQGTCISCATTVARARALALAVLDEAAEGVAAAMQSAQDKLGPMSWTMLEAELRKRIEALS
jgi:hypothetical protein